MKIKKFFIVLISFFFALFIAILIPVYLEQQNTILEAGEVYYAAARYLLFIDAKELLTYDFARVKEYAMKNDFWIRLGEYPYYTYYKGKEKHITKSVETTPQFWEESKTLYLYEDSNNPRFILRGARSKNITVREMEKLKRCFKASQAWNNE